MYQISDFVKLFIHENLTRIKPEVLLSVLLYEYDIEYPMKN